MAKVSKLEAELQNNSTKDVSLSGEYEQKTKHERSINLMPFYSESGVDQSATGESPIFAGSSGTRDSLKQNMAEFEVDMLNAIISSQKNHSSRLADSIVLTVDPVSILTLCVRFSYLLGANQPKELSHR